MPRTDNGIQLGSTLFAEIKQFPEIEILFVYNEPFNEYCIKQNGMNRQDPQRYAIKYRTLDITFRFIIY